MIGADGIEQMAKVGLEDDIFHMADGILNKIASFREGQPKDDMTLIVGELK